MRRLPVAHPLVEKIEVFDEEGEEGNHTHFLSALAGLCKGRHQSVAIGGKVAEWIDKRLRK